MAEEPGEVADRHDAEVGVAGSGERRLEPGPVGPRGLAPRGVGHPGVGQLGAQRVEEAGHLHAEPALRVAGQDVVGEGVAPHERPGVVGGGPDDGDPRRRRAPRTGERQGGPGVEQHDAALRELAGEVSVGR